MQRKIPSPIIVLGVVCFDQLLVAAHTQKLVKLLFQQFSTFFVYFLTFFSDFTPEINKKTSENGQKNMFFFKFCLLLKAGRLPEGVPQNSQFPVDFLVFQPAFGCAQHLKAGRNTQLRG